MLGGFNETQSISLYRGFFLLMGAALLIVPRVSNYVGVQIAHHTVDEFINLKDNIVEGTRPTEQDKESYAENSRSETKTETVLYSVDIDRLYQDSVAYNEMLKTNQNHLLIDETSYLNPALNLSEYGIPTMAQLKRCAFFAFKEECKMKAFANSRDSPILMEVKQLQFTRGGKSMNILKNSYLCLSASG